LRSKKFYERNANAAIKNLESLIEVNKQKLSIILSEKNKKEKILKDAPEKFGFEDKLSIIESYLYLDSINKKDIDKEMGIRNVILNLNKEITTIKSTKNDLEKIYKSLLEGSIFKDGFKMVSFKNFKIKTESNINYKYILIVSVLTLLFIIIYIFSVYQKELRQRN
jgi:hypothetical protein